MTEINPALALEGKIIWRWLAIYICASWLWNAVGEVVSQPSSPCALPASFSAELRAARCEPRLSKSWGKEGLQNLSRASGTPAASIPVGWHWSGLALGWSGSSTTARSCPAVVPGAASAVALPWCCSRNHRLFKHWTLQKSPKSCVFNEDYKK